MSAEDKTSFKHDFKIWISTRCVCKKELPAELRSEVLQEAKRSLSQWFGGFNLHHLESSGYAYKDGTLEEAPIDIVEAFATQGSFEEHHEDFLRLTADVADRLTQESVLVSVDNVPRLYAPRITVTATNCTHRRAGAPPVVVGTTLPTTLPLRNVDKLNAIREILRSFSSVDHARKLFCDVLNYHYATGSLPFTKWPDNVRSLLTGAPTLLVDHNGFKILYLQISANELRRGAERQVILRICKDDPTFRGLIVVSDKQQKSWELVNIKGHGDDSQRFVLRRMRVGVDAVRTVTEGMALLGIAEAEEESITAEEIQDRHERAFDVEAVTKAFFAEIANWYFWALKQTQFPKDAPKEEDGHDHVSVIRMITRLIFCWFVKEKGLIPADLFNERKLTDLLVGFAPGKVPNKESVFYKAILQNLFFATLNMEMDKREWRRNGQNFMAHSLYRYRELFVRPNEALALFKNIPFLNGGLFECLDKDLGEDARPRYVRIDGFSDRADSQPTVPDFLFFGEEREVDLSKDYGDNKFKRVKVRGLIHTLNHYRFTIEESTPLEEEVALDPELAGKIFENLLAAYNPETGSTARKQTGSFYTPREIVNYMVDEALIAYLKGKIEETAPKTTDIEPRLRHLFSYEDEGHRFTPIEVEALIASIDQVKALDPAVGSGAFPMGILHKLVFILGRLDPRNEKWKAMQIAKLDDAIMREQAERVFRDNDGNYGRKLYLIENCLYGVDIQPIAVQIAKMRFFISLIADQKVDLKAENLGVRPLPNLETKLVAANTLIGIDKPKQMMLRNPRIDKLEAELRDVRESSFYARNLRDKKKCREQDKALREEIADLLKSDGWGSAAAKQLAGWDPYDQNSSSEFFDPEWMFGVREGFDVVTGNPPYVRQEAIKEQKTGFQHAYECFTGTADLYVYFYERGVKLLKAGGVLSYISSNKWYRSAYGEKLRTWLGQQTRFLRMIDFGDAPVFTAIAYPTIVLTRRERPSAGAIETLTWNPKWSLSEFEVRVKNNTQPMPQNELKPDGWRLESPVKLRLLERLRSAGTPLGEYAQERFYRGILTGLNEAFVVDQETRNRLVREDSSSKEILKPFLRGRDVKRWRVEPQGLWLIFTRRGIDIKKYPAIHDHLKQFKKALTPGISGGRKPGSYQWYEIQDNIAYWQEFEKPKVVVPAIEDEVNYAPDSAAFYTNDKTSIFIPPSLPFALAIVNSQVSWWITRQSFASRQGGFFEFKPMYVSKLPIPSANSAQQSDLEKRVNRIIAAIKKDSATDVSALEREVDEIVYKLYGLTKDEIKIVEEGR